MANRKSNEAVSCKLLPFMGSGVEVLRAHYVTQTFSKHFHEGYAVGFIESGAMGFRYRGSNLLASKGSINLVVPGEIHDGHAASDEGWRYRMFYLPPEVLMSAARELGSKPVQPYFSMGVLEDTELAAAIYEAHFILQQDEATVLEKETLLLRMLISWISRHGEVRTNCPGVGSEHRAVRLAREYMQDQPAENVGLEKLAGLGGLSPFHFVRVFEKHFGITPHAYLMQTRVNHAKNMLSRSMRIADIAAECGFADQSHLTRQFRRQFGLTPGQYRKIVQNN
ncbi:AraC family transcriptional regulator [Desulfovibrio sp. UCD-KL4C]|uniref:AraC family transcriptional regulator n=1 Tax=Desulfovibrio sp. UCD-KL4C TaxID=2578120 RepID=UPI0025BE32B0|nr:AraC family transcriptional regulator [Desulfovibrio sp. UCD-KL4C]